MRRVPYGLAAAAFLGGAWLIAVWMFGVAVMVEAVLFALLWDDGRPARQHAPAGGRTLRQVLDDYERAA